MHNAFAGWYDQPDYPPTLNPRGDEIYDWTSVPKPGTDPEAVTLRIGPVELVIQLDPPCGGENVYTIRIYTSVTDAEPAAVLAYPAPPPKPTIEEIYREFLGENAHE